MSTVAKQEENVIFDASVVDEDGVAVDLSSGWTGRFVVQRRGDASLLIDIDQTDPDLEFNYGGVDGAVRATIQSADTVLLGTYVCQIQTTETVSGLTRSILESLRVTDTPGEGGLNG
jgi:hypothetical protein